MDEQLLKTQLRKALITHPETQLDKRFAIDDCTQGFGKGFPGRIDWENNYSLTFAMEPADVEGMNVRELTRILVEVLQEKLPPEIDIHTLFTESKLSPNVFVALPAGYTGAFDDKAKFQVNNYLLGMYRNIVRAD